MDGLASEKRSMDRSFGNLEKNPEPPIAGVGAPIPGIGAPGPGVGGVHPAGGAVGGGGQTAAFAEVNGSVAHSPRVTEKAARALRTFIPQ